jgi:hypothetical protein
MRAPKISTRNPGEDRYYSSVNGAILGPRVGDRKTAFPNSVYPELPDPGIEESDGKTGRRALATPVVAVVLPSSAGVE